MRSNSKIIPSLAFVAIATATLVGCSPAADTASLPTAEKTVALDAPAEAPAEDTFENQTLTTPEVVIKITDVKTIPVGEVGNEYGEKPVIAFWYDTTNIAGESIDPLIWINYFSAYQDNNPNAENELQPGMLPDDRFGESQMEKIKKGGTVANAVSYELDDTTTPVKLVAADMFGESEIGSMTFELK
ncbi:DUF5067 domain-containing protein [Microbacterium sp. NPDC089318]